MKKQNILAMIIATSILLVTTSGASSAIFFTLSTGSKIKINEYRPQGVLLHTSPWQYMVSKKMDSDSADLFVILKNPASAKKNNGKVVITLVVPGTKKPGMTAGMPTQLAVRDTQSKGFTVMCRDINGQKIALLQNSGSGLVDIPSGVHWITMKPVKLGPTLSAIYIDGKIVEAKGTTPSEAIEMSME